MESISSFYFSFRNREILLSTFEQPPDSAVSVFQNSDRGTHYFYTNDESSQPLPHTLRYDKKQATLSLQQPSTLGTGFRFLH